MYKLLIYYIDRDLGMVVDLPVYFQNFKYQVLKCNKHWITTNTKFNEDINIALKESNAVLTHFTDNQKIFKYYLTFDSQDNHIAFVLKWS